MYAGDVCIQYVMSSLRATCSPFYVYFNSRISWFTPVENHPLSTWYPDGQSADSRPPQKKTRNNAFLEKQQVISPASLSTFHRRILTFT